MNKKEKFYIATSIAYVNAAPHLGHALEFIQADIIARYMRIAGKEVYFLTGTDEHGAKIARSAKEANKNIENFVNENAEKFKILIQKLNISNDDFIRTSDRIRHFPAVQEIWKRLSANNDIYKKSYKGLYCVGHEAFITEKDLDKDGKCLLHETKPETVEEENYFFRLSRYQEQLKNLIKEDELKIIPETRKNEVLSFIGEGLEDLSISRPAKDIAWGVPVPGDATQTVYVWFDALCNYISALEFGSKDISKFNKFWPANLHVIGKDILRFHAVIWPAMLISANLPLPKEIFIHGFITVGGRKMSKTIGNVADPFPLIEKYGEDALRAYLIREIPVFDDGDYTEEKFKMFYNGELAKGIGNLVSRISAMGLKYFNGLIKKPDETLLAAIPLKKRIFLSDNNEQERQEIESLKLDQFIEQKILEYHNAFSRHKINEALDAVFKISKILDRYIQEYEPFKLIEKDKEKTQAILWNLCFASGKLAFFLKPFMPNTSEKILDIFSFNEKSREFKISSHDPLFPNKE